VSLPAVGALSPPTKVPTPDSCDSHGAARSRRGCTPASSATRHPGSRASPFPRQFRVGERQAAIVANSSSPGSEARPAIRATLGGRQHPAGRAGVRRSAEPGNRSAAGRPGPRFDCGRNSPSRVGVPRTGLGVMVPADTTLFAGEHPDGCPGFEGRVAARPRPEASRRAPERSFLGRGLGVGRTLAVV